MDSELISVEDENNLDSETCQKLVEEFAAVTNTDEALAQFYLQDHNWKLEPSLNAYYEAQGGTRGSGSNEEVMVTFESVMSSLGAKVSTKPPDKFKFITWNLDGLDEHNLKKRTKAVIKIIEMELPDVVFLQEVIPVTFTYMEEHLPQYMLIAGGTEEYFVATMLKQTSVYFDGHSIHSYPSTRMGRNLLFVDCHIGSLKLRLLNSHLESTAEGAIERKAQLRTALTLLRSGTKEHTSIFAGDLNLREKEVVEVEIPRDVYDMWETCGRREECKYTWDTLRNTNKEIASRFKPRARYDRVYLHQSSPPSVTPRHFGLLGIQKVAGTQSFPSDHWGICVHYDIVNQTALSSSPPPSHSVPKLLSSPSTSKFTKDSNNTIECLELSEDSIHVIEEIDQSSREGSAPKSLSPTSGKRKRYVVDLE